MPDKTFTASLFSKELPPGWKVVPAGAVLASTQYGLSEPGDAEGNIPIVGMKDIANGIVNLDNLAMIDGGADDWANFQLRRGDILLNRTNSPDLVGKVGIVLSDTQAVFASYLVRLNPNSTCIEPEFLNYWLNSPIAQRALKRLSTRGVSQANINPTEFQKHCPVPLPPLDEQRKIADILRSWDEAIEKLKGLRGTKSDQLIGLTQRLIGRGGDLPNRWELRPLSAISTRITRQNSGGDHPVMTISAKTGFLMQSDKFSRDMAGRSVERYTLLRKGEFAYNKGNSQTAPYGYIFRLDRQTALVPFVYFCFLLQEALNHEFYTHLFAAGALNHQLSRLINSGVRNDGLLNLYAHDFFSCKVPVPPADKQEKIASALTAAKREIALLDSEIEALSLQKRGLMQKLLTGEWRVSTENYREAAE